MKASIENPMGYFEALYTKEGLLTIEEQFHNSYFETTPHCSYDRKTNTYHLYEQVDDYGNYDTFSYSFVDFLKKHINVQARDARSFFALRMKSCNDENQQKFALSLSLNIIERSEVFLKGSDDLYKKNHLNFLHRLKASLYRIYNENKPSVHTLKLKSIESNELKEKILIDIQSSLQIFEGMDDCKTFIQAVKNNSLSAMDGKSTIHVSCEIWVFKKILLILKDKFKLTWKFVDMETSQLFWDVKKNKLLTAKRLRDAQCKSIKKEAELTKKLEKIFP